MHLDPSFSGSTARRVRRALLAAALAAVAVAVLLPGVAHATVAASSQIQGRVTDASGTPIPHAIVYAQPTNKLPVGYVPTVRVAADGTFSMSVRPGVYWVGVTASGYLGQFFDHVGRVKYATPVIASANRRRRGVDFGLTAEKSVDASSIMTTVAASAPTLATLKQYPRVAAGKVVWSSGDSVYVRDMAASSDTTLTTSSPDAWMSEGVDTNSRYRFCNGYMTDLSTGARTRISKANITGSATDERYVIMSATWSARMLPHTRHGVIVRELSSGLTTFFDFMGNIVTVNPGCVADGRATVSVWTKTGVYIRTLDLAGHRVVPGMVGPIANWSYPTAKPYESNIVYTDSNRAIHMSAPDGTHDLLLVGKPAGSGRTSMIGDGHRLLWEDVSDKGSKLVTYDLESGHSYTVASLPASYYYRIAPDYDVSSDRFVWTTSDLGSASGLTWGEPGGTEVRTSLASDLTTSQRVDDPRPTLDQPGRPMILDGYVSWVSDSGHVVGSYGQDVWAAPLSGGAASLVATDVHFDDSWAPAALSGNRVAWAKLDNAGQAPWMSGDVSVFVTDLATHETTTIAAHLPKYDYSLSAPGWQVDDADIAGSGDWVYLHTRTPIVAGTPYGAHDLLAINAVTGERRVVAAAKADWHALLISAGGGRLLWSDAKGTVRLYDPATGLSPATPVGLGLRGRDYAADGSAVVALMDSRHAWPGWMGAPLTLGSLATGSSTVLNPFTRPAWDVWSGNHLAVSGDRAMVEDRVYETTTGTWFDLHQDGGSPESLDGMSGVDGVSLRGSAVGVSRLDYVPGALGGGLRSTILVGDLDHLDR